MPGVGFRRFRCVVLGMLSVAVRCYCVVSTFFRRPSFVVFGGFAMMLRSGLVMPGRAPVVLCNF